jgi:putative PIN family toxin of toxin-antitoxin system
MKFVVDTDVVVAGMRSPKGASAALLVSLIQRQATLLLSVAVALEYEATCQMAEHRLAAGASEGDVQNLVDALLSISEPVEVHYQWRPQLNDAGDEMVLEAAAEKLSAITTAEAFFSDRKGRANHKAAIQFLTRTGGEAPGTDDQLPN